MRPKEGAGLAAEGTAREDNQRSDAANNANAGAEPSQGSNVATQSRCTGATAATLAIALLALGIGLGVGFLL